MELTPKERAEILFENYYLVRSNSASSITDYFAKQCAKKDIQGKIDLLSELNQTKMCKFDKEIDYWNEVLKELDSL